VADFRTSTNDPSGGSVVRDSSDRSIGYLMLGVVGIIVGTLGALVGSGKGPGGAVAGAFLGITLVFGLYLQFRRPF
jgi:hypothetical protein